MKTKHYHDKKALDVSPRQVIAARALLGWTQTDLASAAGIALATLKRFEIGRTTPIQVVKASIVETLQHADIQFITNGVRIRITKREVIKKPPVTVSTKRVYHP